MKTLYILAITAFVFIHHHAFAYYTLSLSTQRPSRCIPRTHILRFVEIPDEYIQAKNNYSTKTKPTKLKKIRVFLANCIPCKHNQHSTATIEEFREIDMLFNSIHHISDQVNPFSSEEYLKNPNPYIDHFLSDYRKTIREIINDDDLERMKAYLFSIKNQHHPKSTQDVSELIKLYIHHKNMLFKKINIISEKYTDIDLEKINEFEYKLLGDYIYHEYDSITNMINESYKKVFFLVYIYGNIIVNTRGINVRLSRSSILYDFYRGLFSLNNHQINDIHPSRYIFIP